MKLKRTIAKLAAGVFAFASVSFGAAGVAFAEDKKAASLDSNEIALLNAIDTDYIYDIVKYIADEIGIGFGGNPAELARANYYAGLFEDLGYEPFSPATSEDGTDDYLQTFEDERVAAYIGGSVTIGGHEYPANAPNWADNSVYKGYETPSLTGETVYFETADDAIAAADEDISGKIVLTNRVESTEYTYKNDGATYVNDLYADDVRALEAKGAIGVVYFYNKYTISDKGAVSSETTFYAPTEGDEINIPVVLTSYFDGQSIIENLTKDGEVQSAEAAVVNRRNTTTQNVIAVKYAEEKTDKYVMVGAHYDSKFGAIGTNDNTSGAANVLGLAKAFKDIPTDVNVVFALWASEELGLRGSRHFYSSTLADGGYNDKFIAYYNMDMAATSQPSNDVLTIHTPYRDSDNNPIISEAGQLFIQEAERYWDYSNSDGAWGKWWGRSTVNSDEIVEQQYFGSCSDHASITGATSGVPAGEGIPSVYIFWGDGINDEDGSNDVTEQNYHRVGDTYNWKGDSFELEGQTYTGNYSIERAQIIASVIALSLYDTAAEPVEGIKDGETYTGDVSFKVNFGYADNVTIDGEKAESNDGDYIIKADDKEHTVEVANIYGEKATYTITVKSEAKPSETPSSPGTTKLDIFKLGNKCPASYKLSLSKEGTNKTKIVTSWDNIEGAEFEYYWWSTNSAIVKTSTKGDIIVTKGVKKGSATAICLVKATLPDGTTATTGHAMVIKVVK